MRAVRRFLRWGRVGFLRRRMPFVLEVVGTPFRHVAFWLRRPDLAWYCFRVKRGLRRGEYVVAA